MYQTELAEVLRNAINSSGIAQPTPITATVALSPQGAIASEVSHLFVIPDLFEFNIDNSLKRTKVIALNQNPFISIVYGVSYDALDPIDIGTWAESKSHLNYIEALTAYLCKLDYSPLKLTTVEVERVNEMLLDKRKFVSTITMGFTRQC